MKFTVSRLYRLLSSPYVRNALHNILKDFLVVPMNKAGKITFCKIFYACLLNPYG